MKPSLAQDKAAHISKAHPTPFPTKLYTAQKEAFAFVGIFGELIIFSVININRLIDGVTRLINGITRLINGWGPAGPPAGPPSQ